MPVMNINPKLSTKDSRKTRYLPVFQAKKMARGITSTIIALWALATPNQPITPRPRLA